ncbi:hypothetical protein JCM5350_003277 [Sporobolomyces pararoseus]
MEANKPYWSEEEIGYDQTSKEKSLSDQIDSNSETYLAENTSGGYSDHEGRGDGGGGGLLGSEMLFLNLPVIRRCSNAFAPDSQESLIPSVSGHDTEEESSFYIHSRTMQVATAEAAQEGGASTLKRPRLLIETFNQSPLSSSPTRLSDSSSNFVPLSAIVPISSSSSSNSSTTSVLRFESLSLESTTTSTTNLPPYPLPIPPYLLPPLPNSHPLTDTVELEEEDSSVIKLPELLSSTSIDMDDDDSLEEGSVEGIESCVEVKEEDEKMKDSFEGGSLSDSTTRRIFDFSPSSFIDYSLIDEGPSINLLSLDKRPTPSPSLKETTSEFRTPKPRRRSPIKSSPPPIIDRTPSSLDLVSSAPSKHPPNSISSVRSRSASPPVPLKQHPPYPFLLSNSSNSKSNSSPFSQSSSRSRSPNRRKNRNSSRSPIKRNNTVDGSPSKRKRTQAAKEEEENEESSGEEQERRGGIVWVYEKGLESFEQEREVRTSSPLKKKKIRKNQNKLLATTATMEEEGERDV